MKSTNLTCITLAALLAVAIVTPLAAQEPTPDESLGTAAQALNNDHHDRKPKNGRIAVSTVTVVDGAYGPFEIAMVRKHGAPYKFLTSLPNGAFNPDFSRDGTTIFFWSDVDNAPDSIFSVPVEGGAPTQIHTDCSNDPNCGGDDNPAVSPDGRELLAVRVIGPLDANGCLAFVGIYKFRADGSHARKISETGPPCTGDFEPRWSPDGRRIVFQHNEITGLFSLWVMDRNGSHRHQITPPGMDIADPDWSPDGDRIVFESPAETPDDQTPQQIYTIHPDGTHLVQITHYEPVSGQLIVSIWPHWSPDGRKLVFAHRDATTTVGPDGLPHGDLFVMNPDGSNVVQITFTPEKDNAPAWGPRRER
jgi:Tol biopolymer transport system component